MGVTAVALTFIVRWSQRSAGPASAPLTFIVWPVKVELALHQHPTPPLPVVDSRAQQFRLAEAGPKSGECVATVYSIPLARGVPA